ncbi:MAG: hypothetical protein STSR0007_08350 [Thermovirga sp.]
MEKEKVIKTNLACTSDLCTLVEFDAQLLRDMMDDLESGWVESRTQATKCDKGCNRCG